MILRYVLLLTMTLIGSAASLFLKRASDCNGFVDLLTNRNLYLGGGMYLIAAFLNIGLLRLLDYSIVLPLTSITYIWTIVLSRIVLKEKVTRNKIMGVMCIVVGAIVISL